MTTDDNCSLPRHIEGLTFESEVLCELIRWHLQVLKRMPLVQLLLVFNLALLVFRPLDSRMLFGWAMLAVAAECLRAVYARMVSKRGDIDLQPKEVHHRLIVLAAIAGATIGLSAVLFFLPSHCPIRHCLSLSCSPCRRWAFR